MKLLAFHNDPCVKDKYLARVRAHAAADEIISGAYWQRGRGCAVGCTIHSDSHAKYETELGIPQVLACLEDRLFESIYCNDPETAKAWPERFLNAPKLGADLTKVWPKFAHWLLVDSECGVIRFAKREKTKAAIQSVAALYQHWIDGYKPERKEWITAANAANAANAAAYAAAEAAAAEAAAAEAAEAAAEAAAYAAAEAAEAAYAAAEAAAYATTTTAYALSNHYKIMAVKLIQLMEAA